MMIEWVFKNFSLFSVCVGFLISLSIIFIKRIQDREKIIDSFLSYQLLLGGLTGVYGFVMHGFFPVMTAENIGWANSPFQWEVAVANLGFGLLLLFAFHASAPFRLAAILGSLFWLWGDAMGHVYQMVVANNFTIGNAGSWFWTDVFAPIIFLILFAGWKMEKNKKEVM